MPSTTEVNLARVLYDAYPDSDLLPLDPQQDCQDLEILLQKVRTTDLGDTLFQFIVSETVEGGEGTLEGAIRVLTRARKDVDAVLQALIGARAAHNPCSRCPRPTDRGIWRCPDCCRVLYRSHKKIAEAGTPNCPGCGHEMRLV
jgi:hypothetical protein